MVTHALWMRKFAAQKQQHASNSSNGTFSSIPFGLCHAGWVLVQKYKMHLYGWQLLTNSAPIIPPWHNPSGTLEMYTILLSQQIPFIAHVLASTNESICNLGVPLHVRGGSQI